MTDIKSEWVFHSTLEGVGKIQRRNIFSRIVMGDGCWDWRGPLGPGGYGRVNIGSTSVMAHRLIYTLAVGAIPRGYQLDHLCRNRGCVNPAHLEPVTPRENIMRGEGLAAHNARLTHCSHGHLFDESNTKLRAHGKGRQCRACARDYMRRKRDAWRAAQSSP